MRAADPSRYPQQVCRGLARLLSHGQVNSEEAQWLAKQIGSRLPPGWGAVWTERGCSKLEGTLTDQLQLVVNYLRAMEIRCVGCQVRQAGTCRQCHLGWCALWQQDKEECDVCSVSLTLTADPGAGSAKSYAQRLQAKGMKGAEVASVNMHRLGESFAVGGPKEETGSTVTTTCHRTEGGIGKRSRGGHLLHPRSALCQRDTRARG